MTDPRFASDNVAGVPPAVLDALARANVGAAAPYGADPWTARLVARVREVLRAPAAAVWPLWGGTGANILALRAVTTRVDSVVCAGSSHLVVAETGAPEAVVGVSLVPVPSEAGRLTPEAIVDALPARDGDHRSRPRVLSVAQATESGTVYTPDALRALADVAHARGMLLHVDGARLFNAAAALGADLHEVVTEARVDLLSLGGTKCGLLGAEAVVFLDPLRAPDAGRHRKQITQLASKQRFVSVQLLALLDHDAWRGWAMHGNAMARRLGEGLAAIPGVTLAAPVETNAVFARLPQDAITALRTRYAFEVWHPRSGTIRLMTAWDVEEGDVDALVADVSSACGAGKDAGGDGFR